MESEFLSKRELKALTRIGDLLIPKNDPFPSFSETGCIESVDIAVRNLDQADLSDLKLFFKIVSILPGFLVKFIIRWMNGSKIGLLRLGNLGIRGIVFSLYYSNHHSDTYKGKSIHELIGYSVKTVFKNS